MSFNIESDQKRFQEIIRNKVKHNLGKYVSSDHLVGQQGKKTFKIPINNIDMPRFIHGSQSGAGMGPGKPGDPFGEANPQPGSGGVGDKEGDHQFIAEFSTDDLAKILAEELQLPDIEDKGKGKINSASNKYSSIRKTGPEGLKSFKRTYKEALKREIAFGSYDPSNPKIIPIKDDKRYRSFDEVETPENNTAVIYIMDVSGSMGDEQKHIVKSEVFWIDLWLTYQYKNIETRFIVHDTLAKEVTRDEFFSITESGGTIISTAYKFCNELMKEDYPFSSWNVYPFHFSDGDNWSSSDTTESIRFLRHEIMPNCNVFSYGQVASGLGSGDFIKDLAHGFSSTDNITLSQIDSEQDILLSIKTFFNKGK